MSDQIEISKLNSSNCLSKLQTPNPFSWRAEPKRELVKWVESYFQKLREQGYALYAVTLTYKESNAYELTPATISGCLDKFYKTSVLQNLVHPDRYHLAKFKALHPILWAFVDVAESKHKFRVASRSPHPNTIHHHAILAAPEAIKKNTDRHLGENAFCLPLYANPKLPSIIKTSDLQSIHKDRDLARWAAYATEYAVSIQNQPHACWMSFLGPCERGLSEIGEGRVQPSRLG